MSTELTKGLPGPDSILWKQFANGVTVLVRENPGSRTAAVHGSLFAGSCLDFPEKYGLSAFVSASLTAGTRSRDFTQFSDHLDDIGAGLSFSTDPHSIEFSGKCLCENLLDLLGLLKEVLDEPTFPEHYLDILRQRALDGYDTDYDEPQGFTFEILKNLMWDDHPYGRRKFESDQSIRDITRSDLVKFHEKFFGPKRLILALAGGFRGQDVMDRCEKIFGSWKKQQELPDEDALFPPVSRKSGHVRYHLNLDTEEEISLAIGTFAPAFTDPDHDAARLGDMILCANSLTSRIGQSIREKHGWAYNAQSIMESYKKGGSWAVTAEIAPENLEMTGTMIIEEIKRFTSEPVSSGELEDAKSEFINRLPLYFINNSAAASTLHDLAYRQRTPDYFLRLPGLIRSVTPDMVLETAKKWIDPKRLVIITAGPWYEDNDDQFWWPDFYDPKTDRKKYLDALDDEDDADDGNDVDNEMGKSSDRIPNNSSERGK